MLHTMQLGKYSFSRTCFSGSLLCKIFCFVDSNLVHELKLAKLDIFLKFKLESGSIYKYEKLKLLLSCKIYLTIHNRVHELDFCDSIGNEEN